ncbi:alpha/beta fold hydrolase [Amycolatopsis sp. cmx-11-51]|uniref:alpha/beta fold hydrolase n=1 Tax=unclassified Amycolatopsis TaxID=2618356 RepID=UPI0039E696C7
MFTASDHATLSGDWQWFLDVVGPALEGGPGGLIDDDLAYVAPWGFQPSDVKAPVLLPHGGADRIAPFGHGEWLARRIATAELRAYPEDGHISILRHGESVLEWLAEHA